MLLFDNKPMFPALACSNSPKMAVSKAVLFCRLAGAYQTRLQAVNQLNWHSSRMMVFPAPVEPSIHSVFHVAHLRVPPKICNAVVCWVAVVVTSQLTVFWLTVKSHQNKPRNKFRVLLFVDTKPDGYVTASVVLRKKTPIVFLGHNFANQHGKLDYRPRVRINSAHV